MTHLKTLQQAFAFFSDRQSCIDYMVSRRWPDGVVTCPTCGSLDVRFLKSRGVFCCKNRHAKWQFSVKVGTIMEDSPIALGDWLLMGWMLVNCRNGISSHEVARTIGITQKSAWFMLHRLRKAMTNEGLTLSGIIEGDETYVGGREKNRHVKARKGDSGRTTKGKTPVFGLVERGGSVIAQALPDAKEVNVLPVIQQSVTKDDSLLITDDYPIYDKLVRLGYNHEVINHRHDSFVSGPIHTNTIENFWACLKRTLKGTYISVLPKHLGAYVAEQGFRFNHRRGFSEQQRFAAVLDGVTGKRLTYKELTA